ncbi:GNAT domain-containing protein [Aspergillus pseudoustus]|uniref:GNAT domain-containing protein n=1 Tax=Aspergillus pseudoustus TaxID=1810923 RepID=A0ABR4IRQ6_9EURO
MDILPHQNIRVQLPNQLPSITTKNLVLRPLADSDAEDLFAIRSRSEVAKTNHPKTPHRSVAETREWMATKIFVEGAEHLIGRHFTYILIEIKDRDHHDDQPRSGDGRVIGYVGINEVYPSPEIGYSIHPDYWGKGYATEALNALLKLWWSLPRQGQDDNLVEETDSVFAICEKSNLGSGKVLSKCGFRVLREMTFEDDGGLDELFIWQLERPV